MGHGDTDGSQDGEIKAISNIELLEDGTYGEALNRRRFLPLNRGSVMKPISLMIAFEDGLVKHVTDQVSCAPSSVQATHTAPE